MQSLIFEILEISKLKNVFSFLFKNSFLKIKFSKNPEPMLNGNG